MRYQVEFMRLPDIPQVIQIERESFSSPWSPRAYEKDLTDNELAYYVVLREAPDEGAEGESSRGYPMDGAAETGSPRRGPSAEKAGALAALKGRLASLIWPGALEKAKAPSQLPIVGFAGMWLMVEDAHLVTVAVKPSHRRQGLGELLLIEMLNLSHRLNAQRMTLEVRVSNYAAQALYQKYGFTVQGVRRRYYSDNDEDALLMTSDNLNSPSFVRRLQERHGELQQKINWKPL
ncbi:MAG: ribosomal protein S18-alanine N-acetyltransferase [Chloroflexi bacterium]|nr:ribosomal protein S18-alanine N-acetyltransferase [Chloroflexota bacterium]